MLKITFSDAVPTSLFSSKTEQFWPLVPPIEAVRCERTKPLSGLQRGNTKFLLGLPLFLIRVKVTELKYVVLQPVYQIVRELGWSLRV